jgi:hypothetical protein
MLAYLQGMARTKDEHATVVVNLTMQHVVQRPRRMIKSPGPELTTQIGCYGLEHNDIFPGKLGWCHKIKQWITLEDCGRCEFNPHFQGSGFK